MPEASTEKDEVAIDPITGQRAGLVDRLTEFCFGFRRQGFIGVEDENPVVAKREMLERPVLFLGPGAIEFELRHSCAVFPGNVD